MNKRSKTIITAALPALLLLVPFGARAWMHIAARGQIYHDPLELPGCRVALVLGAGVRPDGSLSPLLKDRVDTAVALYRAGKVRKLLMSGDNRVSHYNEPARMRDYAVKQGVPRGDIACDYAGRRTYDSVYRARHVFGLREAVIVSQRFHLDRAVFLCDSLGVRACGISGRRTNARAWVREIPASLGALVDVYIRKPSPVLGRPERI